MIMENETKKEAKTRTSITMTPSVLEQLRAHCESRSMSVSAFIEKAVVAQLSTSDVDRV